MLAEMLETILISDADILETLLELRKGMDRAFCCRLFNDVVQCSEYGRSPLFTCSLEAERWFDMCNSSLFVNL